MISKTTQYLAEKIQKKRQALWDWQMTYVKKSPPPFYCSVDLRDSGYKVVPVDSNLYPGGFNNICPEDLRAAPPIFRAHVDAVFSRKGMPSGERILLIPESHTQNAYYIENLYYLNEIVQNAGFETRIGWYSAVPEGQTVPIQLTSVTGKVLSAFPIQINNGVISAGDFVPDLVLLNNDFSGGYPAPLDWVTQPILPSHVLGWHSRKKSDHFFHYNRLAGEFADIIGVDPWLIQVDTEEVTPVHFNENIGIDQVAQSVDRILERMTQAFQTHEVRRKPFAFVKNNSGTYGMGIMVAHSADDVLHINRRIKNKMSVGKNHSAIESVVVQEGVPTATHINHLAAEPVIYLFGSELIGGFLRSNTEKGEEDNLNSQGMVFRKLCMSDLRDPEAEEPVLELVYGSVARISTLATGLELLKALDNHETRDDSLKSHGLL